VLRRIDLARTLALKLLFNNNKKATFKTEYAM